MPFLIAVVVVQIVETVVCGFNLMTLFSLLPRIMFACRIAGTVFKATTLTVLECVAFGAWIIWRAVIIRRFRLLQFIVFLICVLVCVVIYFIDTHLYVYVVEDDDM